MSETSVSNFANAQISRDRAVGAMLAFAIGDALGWPQEKPELRLGKGARTQIPPRIEFAEWRRRSGSRFCAFEEVIGTGEYSDDTQLLLASARSLSGEHPWKLVLASQELPLWPLYERGGGRTVNRSAQCWLQNKPPWLAAPDVVSGYYQAGANGAVMRVLPHALVARLSNVEMLNQVMFNAALTHGHPRALLGALLYAHAAHLMLRLDSSLGFGQLIEYLVDTREEWSVLRKWDRGFDRWWVAANTVHRDYQAVWNSAVGEVETGLRIVSQAIKRGAISTSGDFLQRIGALDKATQGSGTVATLAAIYYASSYASDPVPGMLEAAYAYGADTDTIAALTGGLLGGLLGTSWLPSEWHSVQDREYLTHLAKLLLTADPVSELQSAVDRWTEKDTERVLLELKQQRSWIELYLGPLGHAAVVEELNQRQVSGSTRTKRWRLRTDKGQTLYITSKVASERKDGNPATVRHEEQPRQQVSRMTPILSGLFTALGELWAGGGDVEPAIAHDGGHRGVDRDGPPRFAGVRQLG